MPSISISKSVWIDTEVDVDIDDFSDADLVAEVRKRDITLMDDGDPHFAIRDAFKLGRDALALELSRAMICDMFGVVL